MDFKRVNIILLADFWVMLLTLIVLIAVCELLPEYAGLAAGDEMSQYLMGTICTLLTLGCIPLAMYLLRIGWVKDSYAGNTNRFLAWTLLRQGLLAITAICDAVGYYLFLEKSFFYLVVITLVSMVFIYPSRARLEREFND